VGKELTEAGWTAIPNVIFQRQRALGLDSVDINILLQLAAYWWTPGNHPFPSKARIAEAIGIDPRTVQRRIAQLEKGALIKRIPRRLASGSSRTNKYDPTPLATAAKPYALEELQEVARRKKEKIEKLARKRPKLDVIEGDKKSAA
jgi:DNA-binding Lrp family transcriptional regulator